MSGPHRVDDPPWLRAPARKVGAKKWVKKKTAFDRQFYFETIDIWRQRTVTKTGLEPSDAALAAMVAVMIEGIGDLRKHANDERVYPDGEKEWGEMTEGAAWVVVAAYWRDIEKGEWQA